MMDFLVIGGGIAGVSAGARLAPHGRVTVLEAEGGLGYHTSGRSAAMFEERYGKPQIIALNEASRDHHQTADGGLLSPRGLMIVAGEDEADLFEADLATMQLPRISIDEATALFPVLDTRAVRDAAYHADAWDIDTDRLIQTFAREVRAHGGQVLTGKAVEEIARAGNGWRVTAGGETFEAAVIVNAAGAWADRIAEMAGAPPVGLTPLRRSMARLPAPGGHDVSDWPMVMGTGERWYAKPDAGKLLVSPAEEDPSEPHDAWADDLVIAEGLARYEAMVTEPVTRVENTWAGLRTFAPDRLMVIGPDPGLSGFFWCAGQGGYGMQTSPAASACLAAHVTGAAQALPDDVVTAFLPGRFR